MFIYHYIVSVSVEKSTFFLHYNRSWSENPKNFIEQEFMPISLKCSGNFIQYKNKFVVVKNVLIDKTKSIGLNGGENIKTVLKQNERSEFYKYEQGFISIPCSNLRREDTVFPLGPLNHINEFYSSLSYFPPRLLDFIRTDDIYNKTVFFVTRNEYANFYHTITDFYVIFIVCRILQVTKDEIHVVLTDGHPWSNLDHVWLELFPHFSRLSQFSTSDFILLKQSVWLPFGYIAPLMQLDWPTAPMLHEFREDILKQYNMNHGDSVASRSCLDISVLFVWRHNYLAHPRNPSGEISRKISNEKELVSELLFAAKNDSFLMKFNISIKETQLDQLPMRDQLKLVTNTNILIGMHGAGLTHAIFLPANAALIELFPLYYNEKNTHFKAISRWRNLHYEYYANKNSKFEVSKYLTFIPPHVVIDRVRLVLERLNCVFTDLDTVL